MRIHHEELSDVTRYVESSRHLSLEDKEGHFRGYMRALRGYKEIDASTRILEIGTGTGWFPLLCKKKNLQCKGLEISPQLVEYAREWGKRCGLEPDVELGNIEETDIGHDEYDVIIASSVFEHVEHWRAGLERVYDALRPGGALFFESTNKFSFSSGEYRFPLYGWLPDGIRYGLRRKVHGDDIMQLGIDFNQFTYPLLRKEFARLGFSMIFDRVDMANPAYVSATWKKQTVLLARRSRPIKFIALTFADTTRFVCIK